MHPLFATIFHVGSSTYMCRDTRQKEKERKFRNALKEVLLIEARSFQRYFLFFCKSVVTAPELAKVVDDIFNLIMIGSLGEKLLSNLRLRVGLDSLSVDEYTRSFRQVDWGDRSEHPIFVDCFNRLRHSGETIALILFVLQ
jgi:hypothetical protein